tara:strand:- start:2830 stop:3714 length:885 start_codon:yes stop_codon:yes gene_type:complete
MSNFKNIPNPTKVTGPFNKAAEIFGESPFQEPRRQNQFQLKFNINHDSYPSEVIFDRVSSLSLPDHNYNVMMLNQYNRHRYITTRLTPGTIGVQFYDTKDSQFQVMLEKYTAKYTHGFQVPGNIASLNDVVSPEFNNTFGVQPTKNGSGRYFFNNITITTFDVGGKTGATRTIEAFNCMISAASHDNMDYASASAVMWNVQFQPEHINMRTDSEGAPISPDDSTGSDVYRSVTEGNTVFAKDENGNYMTDSTGARVIVERVGSATSLSTAVGDLLEDGKVALNEAGNAIKSLFS